MNELVLKGPFLTRVQAAKALGLRSPEVVKRPELLRITGLLQECYFAFQCHPNAVGRDLGRVVLAMRGFMNDQEIADWLVRQNSQLKDVAPLGWLQQRWGLVPVLNAAELHMGLP